MDRSKEIKQSTKVKSILVISIYSAFSIALGFIKLPAGVGSVALDSSPGFFVAGFYTPILGGFTGMIGHIASSWVSGFPLGIVHIPIAFMQFCWCFIFGFILRKGNSLTSLIIASIVATLLNGVLAPILIGLIFPDLTTIMTGLILFLVIASAINVVIAASMIKVVSKLNIPEL